ncbi:MAG: sigma 54-interacting transcriptional regulator [Pseudomonadota bacterium]
MKDIILDYLKHIESLEKYSLSSIKCYVKRLNDLKIFLAKKQEVEQIDLNDIKAFLKNLEDNNTAIGTYNQYVTSIKGLLKFQSNIQKTKDLSKEIKVKASEQISTISKKAIITFLENIKDIEDTNKTLFLLYILTDINLKETLNLKKKDILIEEGRIGIKKSEKNVYSYYLIHTNKYGVRLKKELSIIIEKTNKYLFESSKAKPMSPPHVNYLFNKYKKYIPENCDSIMKLKSSELFLGIKGKDIIVKIPENYEVKNLLADGLDCNLYHCYDHTRKIDLVIKIINNPSYSNESFQRLKNEFTLLKSLKHSSLPKVYDFVHKAEEKLAFFTMEFFGQKALSYFKKKVSEKDALFILHTMLELLSYLKINNIIHHDINPANILFKKTTNNTYELKLIDFGLASKKESCTCNCTIKGTNYFIAPEIVFNKKATYRSDIYSLGITLYNILCEDFPFSTENPDKMLKDIKSNSYVLLNQKNKKISDKFSDIIAKMTVYDPDKRYQNENIIKKEIQTFLQSGELFEDSSENEIIIRLPDYVKKNEELEEIISDMNMIYSDAIIHANPQINIISGETSIGKTRLISEIKNQASSSEINIFEFDIEKENPLACILEFASKNKEFKVELSEKEESNLNSYSTKLQMKLASILVKELQAQKSILIFEHIAYFKRAFYPFLRFLVKELTSKNVSALIIFSINTDHADPKIINDIITQKQEAKLKTSIIPLDRFAKKEIKLFVESSLNKAIETKLLDYLAQNSGGNPGLVLMILNKLNDDGALINKNNFISLKEENLVSFENKTLEIAKNRIKHLKTLERNIVSILSIIEMNIGMDEIFKLLLSLNANASETEILIILEELIKRNFISQLDISPSQNNILSNIKSYSIQDKNISNSIDRILITKEKKAIHLSIAQMLESHSNFNNIPKEKIALHYKAAGDKKIAYKFFLLAAEENLSIFNLERSVYNYKEAIMQIDDISQSIITEKKNHILFKLAKIQMQMGDYQDSENSLNAIDKILLTIKDEIEYHKVIGRLLNRKGKQTEAIEYFEKSLNFSDIAKYPELHQELILYKISALLDSHNYQEVVSIISDLSDFNFTDKNQATYYYLLGSLHYHKQDTNNAIDNLKLSLNLSIKISDKYGILNASNMLGSTYYFLRDFNKAIHCYNEALLQAKHLSDLYLNGLILQNLASCYFQKGSLNNSLLNYLETYDLFSDLDFPRGSEALLLNIGLVYLEIGNINLALKYKEKSLKLAIKRDNKMIVAYNHYLEGEILANNKDLENSFSSFSLAQKTFDSMQIEIASLETSLAIIKLRIANNDLDAANKALEEIKHKTIRDKKVTIEIRLIQSYLALKNNDLLLAKELLESIDINQIETQNYNTKLYYYKIYTNYFDTIANQEQASSFAKKIIKLITYLSNNVPESSKIDFFNKDKIKTAKHLAAKVLMQNEELSSNNKLQTISNLLMSLASIKDVNKLYNSILDNAILFSNAKKGYILLFDEKNPRGKAANNYKIIAARNFLNSELNKSSQILSQTILNKTLKQDQILNTENAIEAFENSRSIAEAKLKSILSLPIIYDKNIIGLVYLEDSDKIGTFSKIDKNFIQTFVYAISNIIASSMLIEELKVKTSIIETHNLNLENQLSNAESKCEKASRVIKEAKIIDLPLYNNKNIISQSEALKTIFKIIEQVKDSDIPILVTGETGTGKELIARSIHYNSKRREKEFFSENCAALSESLLESELFGHVKGSFTDAITDKKGIFEIADGGSIFLDEIGEMSLEMQKKFLRVLQEKTIRPVGANKTIKVDFRLICATHRDLKKMIAKGEFRSDLYYRINAVEIHNPALRNRKEDIPILVKHFLSKYADGEEKRFSKELLTCFIHYAWPGNIRELENEVKRLILLSKNKLITKEDLHDNRFKEGEQVKENIMTLAEAEKKAIWLALKHTNGNQKSASALLGIDRKTILRKIKKYRIPL